jgi:hypothetical protein
MRPRVFNIDIASQAISGDSAFFREDVEKIRLRFTENGQPVDYSSATVKMGIGSIGTPLAGFFKISDSVSTSAAISFSATAAEVKTALDAMNTSSGVFSAGACTVTGAMPRYTVTVGSNNTGNTSNLGAPDNTLSPDTAARFMQRQAPSSTEPLVFDIVFSRVPSVLQASWTNLSAGITTTVTTVVNGGSGASEQQLITFSQQPEQGTFAIVMPERNVTVSSVASGIFTAANHGLYDGQSVTMTAFSISANFANGAQYFVIDRTKDTFKISNTANGQAINAQVTSAGGTAQLDAITVGPILYNASVASVSSAFVDSGFSVNGLPQIAVAGTVGQELRLTFSGGSGNINFSPVTIASDLRVAPTLEADVSFNTFGVRDALERGDDFQILEIEVSQGGARKTFRSSASFSPDLLVDAAFAPVAVPFAGAVTLQSPNASLWSVTIDNDGVLTATKQ